MKRWTLFAVVVAALCAGLTAASATPAAGKNPNRLDVYTAVVSAEELAIVAQLGIDEHGQRRVKNGTALDIVLTRAQAEQFRARGIDLKLKRVKGGLTVRQFAARQALNGFTVWRSYD